jgi:Ribonuclease E/G family
MRATLCIDDAVGESRRALLDPFGKPFRLEIERWSERGRRAKLDEVWWGRVRARTPGNRGWFVDVGLDHDGVIEATRAAAVTEGAMIPVRVKSEAYADKGPALSLADMSPSVVRPDRPGLHAPPADDPFLRGVEVIATIRRQAARTQVDAAIEEAGQRVVALEGGGNISIEGTRGLTAIDVDAAERAGGGDSFATELNLAAADEAARQIGLRGIGGLVAVDFVSMDERKDQRAVEGAFRRSLAAWLGRASEVLEVSRFGVCEAALARRTRAVRDALAAGAAEREALDALRGMESAGWAARGARIHARVSEATAKWLEADHIGWKNALADSIGARWMLESTARSPGRPDVWSA